MKTYIRSKVRADMGETGMGGDTWEVVSQPAEV
jgi:hypothetical protein